ncbi:hypothetical protein C3E89_01675 [Clostridium sp. Cult1]|nr:hypothetical protein [Clostridium sp. Cult1]
MINDKEVEADEEGNFYERLIVDEGENLITVKAVDLAGNEIIIERTVFVQLEEPTITNILPDEDVELRAGDILTVSFNAPTGGTGYFRLLLPSLQSNNEIGIPMVEEDGLYTGTWIVPEGMEAENLEIEVIYISEYGFEITGIAEGRLTIVLEDDDPSIPEPAITNIQPENDVELRAGDVLDISFNAPADGEGYYRVLLPFNMSNNIEGIPMTEMSEGLYTGTWTVPEGLVAEGLQIEVVFIGRDNIRLAEIAEGKITVIGDIEDMPANAVIMLDEAFDEKYLDSNPEAQLKFIEYSESGQEIYIKINKNTITNLNGEIVDIDVLPDRIIYYNQYGNIERYSK